MTTYPKRLRHRKTANKGAADLFSFATERDALAIESVRRIIRRARVSPAHACVIAETLGWGGRG